MCREVCTTPRTPKLPLELHIRLVPGKLSLKHIQGTIDVRFRELVPPKVLLTARWKPRMKTYDAERGRC